MKLKTAAFALLVATMAIDSRFDVVAASSSSSILDGSDPQATRKTRRVLSEKNQHTCQKEQMEIAGLEGEIIGLKQEIETLKSSPNDGGDNGGDIVGGTKCTSSATGFCNTDGVLAWMVKDSSQDYVWKLTEFIHNNKQDSAYPSWSVVGSQPWDITEPHTILSTTLLRHDLLQPVFGSAGHGGILARMTGSGEQWKMMAVGRACFKDHCVPERDSDYNRFNSPGTCSDDEVQSLVSVCSDRMYGQLQGDPRKRWVEDRDKAVNHQKGEYTGVWNEFHGMAVSPRDVIGIFYPGYKGSPNKAWDNSSPAQWALNACAKLKEMSANHLGSLQTKWPVYEYTIKGDGNITYDNWNNLKNSDAADLKRVGDVSC